MTCGCNDKCELPKALQINNPGEVTLFHRVEIPASQGDDETYPPKNGLYRNVLLVYLANNHAYLYSSDGIPTRVDGDSAVGVPKGGLTGQVLMKKTNEDYDMKWETQTPANDAKLTLTRNNTEIGDFTANASVDKTIDIEVPTKTSDLENDGATGESTYAEATDINAIWEEIEEIEAASDVTDVVGTHAELEAYDTSKLKDNDIIKVLEDETQNDQITYYRWDTDTETFTLIGAIGPYYTKSEANNTFQGKLTAGSNITIDANNEISATDTTYTAGEGININGTTIDAKVRRVYDYYTSRPASANTTATGNGGMFTFQATSTMTTGKPKDDAHILQLEWDNTGGWDSQIALRNNSDEMFLGMRAQNNGVWGSWVYTLLDTAGSVKTANIDALAVTTAKIADGAITEAKINTTDWAKKVNVASIDLSNQTTTLLSLTKALGTAGTDYARWTAKYDGASSGISDKPTGGTNKSFVCEAFCSRWASSSDYGYQLICRSRDYTNPYVAYIDQNTSSIIWSRLSPTVNDATLTIQKNGTTVQTFTANSSTNKTANITVPTKTSDLTNDGADSTSTYVEADELVPGYITGEGTNITLANTQGGRLSDVKLKGDTGQTTYSGKNLFNVFATPVGGNLSEANVAAIVNSDGTISTSGTSTATYKNIRFDTTLPAGTYKFSGCPSGGTVNGYSMLLVASGNSYWDYGSGGTFTLSATTTINVYPVRLGSDTGINMNGKIFKPMITVSTASQTFEPYVGGVASPNPSYPQTVQTVTGEQTITITGKNLCSGISQGYWLNAAADNAGVTSNDSGLIIPVSQNTDYTISATATQARYRIAFSDQVWGGSQFACYNGQNSDNTSASITKNSGTHKYLVVNATDLTKIQVEKGSTATAYESYHGQTYTINLGTTELCKIGDYQDYIYKSNGTWYLHKEIGSQTIDTSTITLRSTYTNIEYAVISKPSSYLYVNTFEPSIDNILCSHATTSDTASWNTSDNIGKIYGNAQSAYFWIGFAKGTGLDSIKATLNGAMLYYKLATVTDTPITGTLLDDLNAFDQATSYKGNTYITVSSVSPDLPATLSVAVEQESALPVATETSVGVVSVGDGLEVTDGGVLSVDPSRKEVYSTTEQVIGTWIDGKPLYRKTINFGNLPSSSGQNVTKDHGISNLGYVARIYGSVVNTLGEYYPLPLMFRGGDSNYNVQCWVNSTKILMSTTQDRSNYSAIITLEYTKTTD